MLVSSPQSSDVRVRVLRGLEQLPPFSPVLHNLLRSLNGEDVSFKKLAALVEKDTVLAGYVLRVVNSAAGGFRSRVNSVTHAISLLGTVRLRNLLLGLSASQMWARLRTPPSWSQARFNLHAVAVATYADLLVQEYPAVYPEGAFIAGLLHDLGRLLIAASFRDEFEHEWLRLQAAPDTPPDWLSWERNLLGCTHAELSALALERWQLPVAVQQAAARHHDVSGEIADVPSGVWPLEAILAVADRQVHQLGFGYLSVTQPEEPSPAEREDVGEPWRTLRADFLQEVQPLQEFYLGLDATRGKDEARR